MPCFPRSAVAPGILALALLLACSRGAAPGKEPAAKPAAKPVAAAGSLKYALFHTEQDAFTDTEKWWMQQVAERTQGRVQVTPFFAGSLATATETFSAVRDGSADLGAAAAGVLSGQVPAVSSFEPMGAYPTDPAKWTATMDAARPVLTQIFDRAGVEYLWAQGSVGLVAVCRNKHLRTPDDYRGMKIRAAGRWQGEQLQALGASPVTIDPGEQYLALQNGTVDCALSINTLVVSFKLQEVAPYITELGLAVNLTANVMNRDTWNKIAQADRQIVQEVSYEATSRSVPYLATVQEGAIKQLEQAGAQLYYLTPDEQRAFLQTTVPVFDRVGEQGGDLGAQLAGILRQARGN
jgi:TRAP-type C4-dicarboxylate transport system substrate-binding protein